MQIIKFKSPENPDLPENPLYAGACAFVVHGITHLTNGGKLSAWYSRDNQLLDCEFIDRRGVARSVPMSWHTVRRGLINIGHTYGRH